MTNQTYATNNLMETFIGKDGKEHIVYLAVKVTAYGVSPRTTNDISDITLADDVDVDYAKFFLDPVFNADGEVVDSKAESAELYSEVRKEEEGYRFFFGVGNSYVDNSIWYDGDQDAEEIAEELALGASGEGDWEEAYVNLTDDLDFIQEVLDQRQDVPETPFYTEGDGRFLEK